MKLVQAIEESTGRKSPALESAVLSVLGDDERRFLVDKVHGDDERTLRAAAWCVRRLLEKKRAQKLDLARYFAALARAMPWDAQFHVLQSVRYAPAQALAQVQHVRALLDDERVALRVAAMDAYVHLALVDERYLQEARACVLAAGRDKMPSLRARARQLSEVLQASRRAARRR